LKRRIVAETLMSGSSVSIVARRHDVNPTRYSSGEGDVLQGGRAAGMGIDPPVSLPIARAAMPSVTEIAALDDEPRW